MILELIVRSSITSTYNYPDQHLHLVGVFGCGKLCKKLSKKTIDILFIVLYNGSIN